MRVKLISTLLAALTVFGLFGITAFAAEKPVTREVCGFQLPAEKIYDAKLVSVRNQLRVEKNEDFRVKVFLKNTGSMPWFSDLSRCPGPRMFLGADNPRDHASMFYAENLEGWVANNRIRMDQLRVEPGEIASFTFWGKAGDKSDVYKEFFAPVLTDIQWIDQARFSIDLIVGNHEHSAVELRKKLTYAHESGSADVMDLSAPRSITVDLSDQRAYVKLGDHLIREFPVSSGAPGYATPTGTTTIKLKQQVRIGGKKPFYIMPKFMWFRDGGYGFHGLPSIGNAALRAKIKGLLAEGKPVPTSLYQNDALWTEALDHIGRPVSHGCVRLLPEDSEWLFEFLQIGDTVTVRK